MLAGGAACESALGTCESYWTFARMEQQHKESQTEHLYAQCAEHCLATGRIPFKISGRYWHNRRVSLRSP